MYAPLKIGLASVLALATAAPAMGQSYQPTPQYQQQLDQYQADRQAYDRNRADYRQTRRDYERRRADWEAARADYDARYGYGAYARAYGPEPAWSDDQGAPPPPPSAGYYGRDSSYDAPQVTCRSNNNSAVAAGIIGALAGAALGSNVAARGVRTEGAVLGGVVGGGIGAAVGHANDKYKCDNRGPYYSYNETIPYRESSDFHSGRYDYDHYAQMRCRLAAAPVDRDARDYRYVRVCPDGDGRYRITG
jgi:hypothetical protein